MSFETMSLDSREKKTIVMLRIALQDDGYETADQVIRNLDADSQIPDGPGPSAMPACRRDLLAVIDLGVDERHARLRYRTFCWDHGLEGKPDGAAQTSRLGHVVALDKLAIWFAEANPGLSVSELMAELRSLTRLAGDEAEVLEEQRVSLVAIAPERPLSPFTMWSFYDGESDAPFSRLGKTRNDVLNRLGLGHLVDVAELFCWEHQLPSEVAAVRATAWDADIFPCWRPGGRTEPLDGSGPNAGLPEVVHVPVGAEALRGPIRLLEP